jgi:hypothetical protein
MNRLWAVRRRAALLQCAPLSEKQQPDSSMRSAVARARRNRKTSGAFAIQEKFDRAVAERVSTISMPAEVTDLFANEKLIAPPHKRRWWLNLRNPVVLAIGLALLVILGIAVHTFMNRLEEFPGSVTARRLLTVASGSRLSEMEPVEMDAGALEDLFYMKYRLERFAVPTEFAKFPTTGYRVFDDEEGNRVAQITTAEKRIQLFLWGVEPTKDGMPPDFQDWRWIEQEAWIGAVRQQNGVLVMAAMRGKKKDMQPYLTKPGAE